VTDTFQRDWILERISAFGREGKRFLIAGGREYGFSELADRVEDAHTALREFGVRSGCCVALLSDYSYSAIAAFFALYRNRNMVVPITGAQSEEVESRLRTAAVDFVIRIPEDRAGAIVGAPPRFAIKRIETEGDSSAGGGHPLVEQLTSGRCAGLILFSSGSTGQPKAMIHNLDRLLANYRDRRPRRLVMMVLLMFDHIGGLNTLFHAVATGTVLVVPDRREADHVCDLIETRGVHVLPASPTFLNLMLMSGGLADRNMKSLKIITYGTEPMPEGLLRRLRDALPRVRFVQTFGTSETGITQTTSKSSESTLLRISDPNIEYRVEGGELWLRSGTQILGYLNHDMDRFTEDGWFQTGDIVEETEDCYLRIVGRKEEVINVGGQKVLPSEVETVLMEMPEIADCVVRGAANAITGQAVEAEVVLAAGESEAGIKSKVRRHCRNRLDSFKIPARIRVATKTAYTDRFKKIRNSDGVCEI